MKDIYSFLTFEKVEIIEKTDAYTHTTSILNDNSIRAIFFFGAKLNTTSRNNWKPLFEVNFSKNQGRIQEFLKGGVVHCCSNL